MPDLQRELEVARRLVREAGAKVLEHYATDFDVHFKKQGDPVTEADKDANAIIVAGLRAAFPDDGILAEESADDGPQRLTRRRLWCIDPVDGTREFVEKNGQFAVMVGLAIDGEARLGVVLQPTEDALYWGVGDEAWREQGGVPLRLHVSRRERPSEAVVVSSRSHVSKSVAAVVAALGPAREERLGSVGLKMARIAEGAADVYLSLSTQTHEWDACGPEAILRAAGGRVTDVFGRPLRYNKAESNTPAGLLATNALLHDAVLAAAAPVVAKKLSQV